MSTNDIILTCVAAALICFGLCYAAGTIVEWWDNRKTCKDKGHKYECLRCGARYVSGPDLGYDFPVGDEPAPRVVAREDEISIG